MADDAYFAGKRFGFDEGKKGEATSFAYFFGVSKKFIIVAECEVRREDDRSGYDWASEWTATNFVETGDEMVAFFD